MENAKKISRLDINLKRFVSEPAPSQDNTLAWKTSYVSLGKLVRL